MGSNFGLNIADRASNVALDYHATQKTCLTTGEIVYKQIGKCERYKMVAVSKQSGSKRQETASTLTPAIPSIDVPVDGVDYGEFDDHLQDVGLDSRRTGKVSQ